MAKFSETNQSVFDTLLLMHSERNPDLEKEDSGLRCAFWNGFKVPKGKSPYQKATKEFAAWHAGREAKRRTSVRKVLPESERRKVRTLRMNDARWSCLKYLGTGWLEKKLDEELARIFATTRIRAAEVDNKGASAS